MAEIGSFALLLALALSLYSFLAGIVALVFQNRPSSQLVGSAARKATLAEESSLVTMLRQGSERVGETARRAGIATFGGVLLASVILVICAFQNDFSVSYILHHSNRDLPAAYKFAVLWSGQEGSLLFWSLLLAAYGFVLRLRYKTDPRLFAYASVVLAGVQIFFLLLLNLAANPFGIVQGTIPADGNGLNPLLQYPEMVIHPPMLYLGYVGFTVPFAFALGALIMKYPGEKWIHITRRWTMVTWAFLTCGVFLGAHWAYSVLGWGGYWGWDPVRERLAHALAHRHGFFAFSHDAGKARHVEDVEHVAGVRHILAGHPRNFPDAQRHHQLGARISRSLPLETGLPGFSPSR